MVIMERRSDDMKALQEKMKKGGCSEDQIRRFLKRVERFRSAEQGTISESEIRPVDSIVRWQDLAPRPELLRATVILKLNGGLGTSMGLTGPKGLLTVKDGKDFYAILLDQLRAFEQRDGFRPPLIFMNSFSTQDATEKRLKALGFEQDLPWSFLQSQVPKLDDEGEPVEVDEEYAWCPPGHGDLYASLLDSGLKDKLLERGFRFLFVSNIDNLGAVLDSRPPALMEEQGNPFLMEVTRRGEADKKGGHLARAMDGGLLLREVAQCPEEDLEHFQNIEKHRYFNTNNLWIDLKAITEEWTDLPLIVNRKPVIPHQPDSQKVYQLESAMGAAIGTVDRAGAVEVSRDRFFPVKTTNDLFSVRSDLYSLDPSGAFRAEGDFVPMIDLDPEHYRMIGEYDRLVQGVPSLVRCRSLTVRGSVVIHADDDLEGEVSVHNSDPTPRKLSDF